MSDSAEIDIGILVDVSQVTAAADAVQGLGDASTQASASFSALTASSTTGAASLAALTTQTKSVSDPTGASGSEAMKQTASLSEAADRAVATISKSASSAMSSALKSVVIDGTSFSDAALTLSNRLASSALTTVSSKMFDSLLSSMLGGATSSGAGSGSGGWLSSLFGFANGGVMTASGPVGLRAYANGGVANEPQLALFGEGASSEAYVPLPDGRSIPVTMHGAGGGGPAVNIQMTVSAQDAASFRRSEGQIGATVAAKLQRYMQRYG